MVMERFLYPVQKAFMALSGEIDVMVDGQFGPIFDESPDDTVSPDKADIRPGERRHQKSETHDQGGGNLCAEDGRQQRPGGIRLGEKGLP